MGNWNVVVVGLDGFDASRVALRFAMAEATRRGALLRVAVARDALPDAILGHVPAPQSDDADDELRRRAEDWVRSTAPAEEPLPRHEIVIYTGPPGSALIAASERADLLVVGHRRRNGRTQVSAGASVAQLCADFAHCPVTVIPPLAANGIPGSPGRRFADRGDLGHPEVVPIGDQP